jgi:hypothetical protein
MFTQMTSKPVVLLKDGDVTASRPQQSEQAPRVTGKPTIGTSGPAGSSNNTAQQRLDVSSKIKDDEDEGSRRDVTTRSEEKNETAEGLEGSEKIANQGLEPNTRRVARRGPSFGDGFLVVPEITDDVTAASPEAGDKESEALIERLDVARRATKNNGSDQNENSL